MFRQRPLGVGAPRPSPNDRANQSEQGEDRNSRAVETERTDVGEFADDEHGCQGKCRNGRPRCERSKGEPHRVRDDRAWDEKYGKAADRRCQHEANSTARSPLTHSGLGSGFGVANVTDDEPVGRAFNSNATIGPRSYPPSFDSRQRRRATGRRRSTRLPLSVFKVEMPLSGKRIGEKSLGVEPDACNRRVPLRVRISVDGDAHPPPSGPAKSAVTTF